MSDRPLEAKSPDNPISLSVLVLTYNEEPNLPYLLESLAGWAASIYVVDSGSTDNTIAIAERYGAQVVQRPWVTYADQFNWGLDYFHITTDWTMRMDADEVVMPALADELRRTLPTLPAEVAGLYVKRRVYYRGRWIRHGAFYPTWLLRVFRTGQAHCENRWADEHMVLTQGRTLRLKHDIIDENHNGLRFWTTKHLGYANREMLDLIGENPKAHSDEKTIHLSLTGQQEQRKRWFKVHVYGRTPLFLRAFLYFLYRYVIRLGFLDGVEGLVFHTLQAFWYRFYVDALVWEHQRSRERDES